MSSLPLTFLSSSSSSSSATTATRVSSPFSSSKRFTPILSLRSTIGNSPSSRLSSSSRGKPMADLVKDKDSMLASSSSAGNQSEAVQRMRSKELTHSRTFLDARTEEELLSGIKKELEGGTLPPNVAAGMEELYQNYKKAILKSGVPRADELVLSNMAVAFDRMLVDVEDPFIFSPYHKALREPFDYYVFGQNYIRPLIDFENSFVGNISIFSEMEEKLRQGDNIVLISNHQTEADPAVIAILLEGTNPQIAENMNYVAGDRVITDTLCKPFSLGRNLICVYSKKHMLDDPELVETKRKANTRSLKEMAVLLRNGSNLVWIAPSGGRDRPDPVTGEWSPAPFDFHSVDNMRRLVEHSGAPGHLYPLTVLCHDIMPPPAKVEKNIGEKRETSFHGTGISVAPEVCFSEIAATCDDPEKAKEAYAKAMHDSVSEQYKVLNSAINKKQGLEASIPGVSLSQPWR